jgi:hypothetical protein
MKKWALILRVVGALWMLFALQSKSLPQGKVSNADNEKLDYARSLDVHQLDSTLFHMRLEDWLRSGPAGVGKLNWRTSPSCDLKDPPPLSADKDDWATCVKFVFAYRGTSKSPAYVEGLITVGTVRKGMTGPPRFEYFAFMDNDFFQRNPSWEPNYDDHKLSDLFRALSDLSRLELL